MFTGHKNLRNMDNENEFRDCLVNIYESRNKVVLPINKITCCDNRKPNVYIKHTGKSLAQEIGTAHV